MPKTDPSASVPPTDGSPSSGTRPDPAPGSKPGRPFHVLFVCTGNTCRSPMAEVIARDLISQRGWSGFEVGSAGAGAFPGAPPSGGAVRAAAARGLDLTPHRATLLTRGEVERADLILTMSPAHLARVRDLGGGPRAALLTAYAEGREGGGAAIPDPIGGSDREYEATYLRLRDLVEQVLARLGPEAGR